MTTFQVIAEDALRSIEDDRGEKLDGSLFRLALTLSPFDLEPDGEPSSSLTGYSGQVLLLDPDSYEEVGVVGEVEFAIADLRERGPDWVLDGDADDDAFNILFDGEGGLNEDAQKALGVKYIEVEQLLMLHRLKILPEARGRKVGAMVINRIIQKFGAGCDVIALVCRPLQLNEHPDKDEFDRRMALDALPTDEAKAKKALTRYYRTLGFRAVKGGKGVMVKLP